MFEVFMLMVWTAILTYELTGRKSGPKQGWVIFAVVMIILNLSSLSEALTNV